MIYPPRSIVILLVGMVIIALCGNFFGGTPGVTKTVSGTITPADQMTPVVPVAAQSVTPPSTSSISGTHTINNGEGREEEHGGDE